MKVIIVHRQPVYHSMSTEVFNNLKEFRTSTQHIAAINSLYKCSVFLITSDDIDQLHQLYCMYEDS